MKNSKLKLCNPPTIFDDHVRYRAMVIRALVQELACDMMLKRRKVSPNVSCPSIAEDVRSLKSRIKRLPPLTPKELEIYLLFRPYLVHGKTTFQAGLSGGVLLSGRSKT